MTQLLSHIDRTQLKSGELAQLFCGGTIAAILTKDERVRTLFQSILEWLGLAGTDGVRNHSPFGNLFDLARNYQARNATGGDLLRFQPGFVVDMSRKFLVYENTVNRSLQAFPNDFCLGDQRICVPHEALQLMWNLMSDIFVSVLPKKAHIPFAVQVECLIYPASYSDVSSISDFLSNSNGRWQRLAYHIEKKRSEASGLFNKKIIRDLYAVASLIPGIQRFICMLNDRMLPSNNSVPKDHYLLNRPHCDSGKYLTALVGSRDNVQTDILGLQQWIRLPITASTLAIFPSPKLTSHTGILPTVHRVLLQDYGQKPEFARQNVSLSLSIVDPPQRAELKAYSAAERQPLFTP